MFEANYPEGAHRVFLIHSKYAIRSGRAAMVLWFMFLLPTQRIHSFGNIITW